MKIQIINKVISYLNNRKRALSRLIILMALFLLPTTAYGSTASDLTRKLKELQAARNKLYQTSQVKRTLQGQISNYNSEISLLEQQINITEQQISGLSSQISTTQKDIIESQIEINRTKDNLTGLMRNMYMEGQQSTIERIARSKNFSDFVNSNEYYQKTEAAIRDISLKVLELQKRLIARKSALQAARSQSESLADAKSSQQQEVLSQKSSKDALLSQTKGDEAAYQRLVAKLESEYEAIQRSLWSGTGNYVSLGKVKKGDIIGYVGNSGYSMGTHLHFEVRTKDCYRCDVNPMTYLNKGVMSYPVPKGTYISAGWHVVFSGISAPHTGIDFAARYGTPVRAAADGEIVARKSGRPNTFPWSFEYGNYVKIRHYNGIYSFYGHLR
jgi:peptidoglycan hydrolase CwlO-like protein